MAAWYDFSTLHRPEVKRPPHVGWICDVCACRFRLKGKPTEDKPARCPLCWTDRWNSPTDRHWESVLRDMSGVFMDKVN